MATCCNCFAWLRGKQTKRNSVGDAVKERLNTQVSQCVGTGEQRAIKQIALSDVAADMAFVHAELEAMINLHHPNIVKFYEYFEEEKQLHLVTEMCDGGDLSELNQSITDPNEIKLLFRDIVMAMAYCHDHGLAHRDLKFENCLLAKYETESKSYRVGKVIDFGLSAIRRPGMEKGSWLNDQLGTKYFVAPEVINKEINYGVKCDCWSLGVMLYIILTDEHPCCPDAHAVDTDMLFKKILSGRIRERPLKEHEVDSTAVALVRGLLEKDPNKRMDARNALNSKWLQSAQDNRTRKNSGSFSSSVSAMLGMSGGAGTGMNKGTLKRLASFRHYSKFERAVLTLVAHQSQEQHVADLRQAFHELDTSRTGSLSKDEIRAGIKGCGFKIEEEDINEIFDALDADSTGKVHYTEWLAATMKPSELASDRAIKQVYHYLDLDRTGAISPEELQRVLGCSDAVKSVLKQGDTRGDNQLSQAELGALMRNIAESLEKKHGDSSGSS
eukprot:TRINITY_DN5249_c0_g1_i1.p1 TRINITY_DN5249_c0_g1~~TRINITY_DN5249_c0_g1_i1.p1  ORF type:complete len:499 (-),score=107.44 TRINITY_DN5249_c0_g1_i1:8-1504(-)